MIPAFHVIRAVGRAFFEEMFILVLLSILSMLTLPLVVPFPPALAGLCVIAQRIAEGRTVSVRHWWEGLRHYFLPAWGLALINLAVYGLMLYYLRFYGALPFDIPNWLRAGLQGFWVAALAFWSAWQIYVFPLVLEQKRPHLLRAFRQALVLLVEHPLYTVVFLVLIILLLIISTLVVGLVFFVTPGVVALLIVFATRRLLHGRLEAAE